MATIRGQHLFQKYGAANTEMVKSLVEGSQYVEWLLRSIMLKCTQKSGSDEIIIIRYFSVYDELLDSLILSLISRPITSILSLAILQATENLASFQGYRLSL